MNKEKISIEEAESLLEKAEAVAQEQQDAIDRSYDLWQIEVEKMMPLRKAVEAASARFVRALKSDASITLIGGPLDGEVIG